MKVMSQFVFYAFCSYVRLLFLICLINVFSSIDSFNIFSSQMFLSSTLMISWLKSVVIICLLQVKCWQIRRQTKAPQAAGTIHTDFERGFICAEVIPCSYFLLVWQLSSLLLLLLLFYQIFLPVSYQVFITLSFPFHCETPKRRQEKAKDLHLNASQK